MTMCMKCGKRHGGRFNGDEERCRCQDILDARCREEGHQLESYQSGLGLTWWCSKCRRAFKDAPSV